MSQGIFGQFRKGALGPFRLGNLAGLTRKLGNFLNKPHNWYYIIPDSYTNKLQ